MWSSHLVIMSICNCMFFVTSVPSSATDCTTHVIKQKTIKLMLYFLYYEPAWKAWGCESCLIQFSLVVFAGLYWVLLGLTGPYWTLLDLTGPYWALLDLTGPYWTLVGLLGLTGPYFAFEDWLTNWRTYITTYWAALAAKNPKYARKCISTCFLLLVTNLN